MEHVIHCLVRPRASRALCYPSNMRLHVHHWEPSVHYLASLHTLGVTHLYSYRSYQVPIHYVKGLLTPPIFTIAICTHFTGPMRCEDTPVVVCCDPLFAYPKKGATQGMVETLLGGVLPVVLALVLLALFRWPIHHIPRLFALLDLI
jgi:hypothetical protein